MWRRRLAMVAALAGGAAASPFAWRTAHAPLTTSIEAALARASGLSPSEIHVDRATLRAPARLHVEGVRVGPFGAAEIELRADWAQLASGRVRLGAASARGVDGGALGKIARVDATLGAGRGRLTAHDVSASRAGLPLTVAGLSVEWSCTRPAGASQGACGPSVERAAFSGVRLGGPRGLDELTGHAWRDGAGYRLRAARPGLELTGRVEGAVLEAEVHLDRLPLETAAPLARASGLDLSRAAATGELALHQDAVETHAQGKLRLDELVIDKPALARRPLGPLSVTLTGDATFSAPAITIEELRVELGPIDARLGGHVDPLGFALAVELEPVGCAEALRALPADLLPALDGLTLDGRLGGRARLAGELRHLPDLTLDAALDVGCKVLDDPPLADPRSLAGPVTARGDDGHGKERTFVLFSSNPGFRALGSLPEPVVRAFVIAEDGRFFQHHGFDLDMIRKALAQDLASGRFERGASTITQQVAKNLFLSGERTAARKLEEAVLAWRMEQVVPKRRILELYLNLVELGPGIYGITEAADRYFGKLPEELTVDEAAQLAALLPAPRHGMDAGWQRRYRALMARLPSEHVTIPPVKLAARSTK